MTTHNERKSLAAKFERHADDEGEILAEYRTLSEKLGDSAVGVLVNHIMTEEEIHHLLLRTMAKWLRERPMEQAPAIPQGANRAELLRLTRTLQRHEQETIAACRGLKPRLPKEDGDLLASLLDTLVSDSEKHHRLLSAVEKMLAA